MRVGAMRHKISFLTIEVVQNEILEPIPTESLQLEAYASISPLSGTEKFLGNREAGEVTALFKIRFDSRIDRNMLIAFGGRRFDIVDVQNREERNKEIWILAKERM